MACELDGFRGCLVPRSQITEPSHRGLGGFYPGCMLFTPEPIALVSAVMDESQPADHHRQRESLQHQRGEDDKEGQKDDEIPVRKCDMVRQSQRNSERSRERDASAHPGPGDEKGILPWRIGIALTQGSTACAREIRCRKDPDKTHGNDDSRDETAI